VRCAPSFTNAYRADTWSRVERKNGDQREVLGMQPKSRSHWLIGNKIRYDSAESVE
jgi:hypothetical protein